MDKPDLSERQLIEMARHDREAFGQLYNLHVDRIFSYVYYRTGNRHEAEDLTARVFFRAIQHIEFYEDHGAPFAAWLYRIARNLLSNWYRDTGRRTFLPLDMLPKLRAEGENPELTAMQLEDHDALLTVIRGLPAERQELLILKYVDRLSNAEIGQIMDRSEGAIKSLYHRTLLSLRQEISKADPAERRRRAGKKTRRGRWLQLGD